jgi:hypothetical protein
VIKTGVFNFVFLSYDSRSGSTWLIQNLHKKYSNVISLPEVDITPLAEVYYKYKNPLWGHVQKALDKSKFLEKLSLQNYSFKAVVNNPSKNNFEELLTLIILEYISNKEVGSEIDTIIFKKNAYLFHIDKIRKMLNNAFFLFLIRDPRKIFESKKRTIRPYKTFQFMGHRGVLFHSIKWVYFMRMIEANDNICIINFDSILENEHKEFKKITNFIPLMLSSEKSVKYKFSVLKKETHIHNKIYSKVVSETFLFQNLKKFEIRIIEIVCKQYMKNYNYKLLNEYSVFSKILYAAIGILNMVYKLFISSLQRVYYKIKNISPLIRRK